MPLVNDGITAKSAATYQQCERLLATLNGLVQTTGNKPVPVRVSVNFTGGILVVPSAPGGFDGLRVVPGRAEGFWIDVEACGRLTIRTAEDFFVIQLRPPAPPEGTP